MKFLLALFLVSLGSGALAVLAAAPRVELGVGFFRLIGYFFGGVLVLGAAIAQPGAEGLGGGAWHLLLSAAAVLAVVHALALRSGHAAVETGSRTLAVLAGVAGCTLLAAAMFETTGIRPLLHLGLAAGTSALLLGASAVGMLCGHWYLIDRKLDFWILRRFTKLLAAAVVLRALALVAGLVLLGASAEPAHLALHQLGSLPNLVLLVRAGLGVVLVGGLTYMVWDCVRRKSNQSATGLLYVTLAIVLGSEALALGLALITRGAWL